MKTLFVSWKDTQNTRGWFPVGCLDADVKEGFYRFRYVRGALDAAKRCGFAPFDSFPEFQREYVAGELFTFFANRLQNASRPSFPEYLHRLDVNVRKETPFDPIEVLGISEGRRATDSLEIFPKVERTEEGPFAIKFFLHGWRYLHPQSTERVQRLTPGEELSVAVEVTNQATGFAIQLQTQDRLIVGYAPRYLIMDLFQVIVRCSTPVTAKVSRFNPPPAPPSQRVLVLFEGCWPEGYEPMSGQEFHPLVGERESAFAGAP
jgi:hypothetical protein